MKKTRRRQEEKEKEKEIPFGRFGEGLVWSSHSICSLQHRHTLVISEYGLHFLPTSCHKYELVFLSKMFSRGIEIVFLVCCNAIDLDSDHPKFQLL